MTTAGHVYPWRIRCRFQGRTGFVATDQLRTVDTERLVRRLGHLAAPTLASVLWVLLYIPGIIDVLFPLWDQKRQTIHDKAASSIVVTVP